MPLNTLRRLSTLTSICLAAAMPQTGASQGFAAFITPPRFQLSMDGGQTSRQVLEIQHSGTQIGRYRFYTTDWRFSPEGSVSFSNELLPDSCRPWVAIERRELTLEPGARYRFRFEVSPPTGTAPRECRFAIMIEGLDPAQVTGGLSFPVSGRIGVIVYVSIGGAAPQLSLSSTEVITTNQRSVATLKVLNTGDAHGRLEGFVNGEDASGQKFEMAPSDLPILPGETRSIALNPIPVDGKDMPEIRFPLTVKGRLEWGKNRLPLDVSFAP